MNTQTFAHIALLVILILAARTDLREGRVPNLLNAAGAAAGLVWLSVQADVPRAANSVLAALCIVLILLGIRWISARLIRDPGIGMGDVKLLGVMALFVGWMSFSVFYLACVAGAVFGVGRWMIHRGGESRRMAFVPFILIGYLIEWWASPVGRAVEWLYG